MALVGTGGSNTEQRTCAQSEPCRIYGLSERLEGIRVWGGPERKDMAKFEEVELPKSYRKRIIPDDLYEIRKHADARIARRATTIASLARVISERDVSKGLRRTLQTQARRLEKLATERLNEIAGEIPVAIPGKEDE